MSARRQPSPLSIQLADTAAIGHVNIGLELYRQFEALAHEKRPAGVPLDVNRVLELGVPAVTNLALGLELLLKVHHFQATGEYPFGHDVKVLGSSLPAQALENVRRIYQQIHDDPSVSKGVEFRFAGKPANGSERKWESAKFSTYDLAISYVGTMYVRWRYIYEEFQSDMDIRVAFAPLYLLARAVHLAIRQHTGPTKIVMKDVPPTSA
jgi:hypothetical protein